MLDPAEADNATRYLRAAKRSAHPDAKPMDDGLQDAFTYKTGNNEALLPPEVTNSTLLNSKSTISPGRISETTINQLVDKRTGFTAAISYDPAKREMIIGFAGGFSQGMGFRQGARCILQWLGFVPKNMSQASKLTKIVKKHLEKVNTTLPEGEKITLTLTGYGMGGASASYAALRNEESAVVINSMRLGNGARARVGQMRLDQASKYVTEVAVQGDGLADNGASWIYWPLQIFGIDSFGPLGTARRFMVPRAPNFYDPYDDMIRSFRALKFPAEHLSHTTKNFPESDPANAEIWKAMLAHQDFEPLMERIIPQVPDPNIEYLIEGYKGKRVATAGQVRKYCVEGMAQLLNNQVLGRNRPDPDETAAEFASRLGDLEEEYRKVVALTKEAFSDKLRSEPLKGFLSDIAKMGKSLAAERLFYLAEARSKKTRT